jgi:hypothetical protein
MQQQLVVLRMLLVISVWDPAARTGGVIGDGWCMAEISCCVLRGSTRNYIITSKGTKYRTEYIRQTPSGTHCDWDRSVSTPKGLSYINDWMARMLECSRSIGDLSMATLLGLRTVDLRW